MTPVTKKNQITLAINKYYIDAYFFNTSLKSENKKKKL